MICSEVEYIIKKKIIILDQFHNSMLVEHLKSNKTIKKMY